MGLQRKLLLLCTTLIFAMGLVMVFNTSSADILDRDLNIDTHRALFRQILYGIFGSFCAFLAYTIGYRNLIKAGTPLLWLCTFLLVLVFIPGIGKTVNGARRWIALGPLTLQPSELVKYVIPLFFIHILVRFPQIKWELKSFAKLTSLIAIPVFLIFLEPDTGTTGILGMTIILLFALTGVRLQFWAAPMLAFALLAGVAAYNMPYVRGRLAVYMNPELDIRGRGHQPYQAKIATGSGGLWGRGLGQSLQKLNYLPEAQNDYIAAIYAEEFGFAGVLFLISLYMLLAYLGFHISLCALDKEGLYLAATVTFLICIQVFLNLGVVSGLLPSTGLNLPFFSQGGTSLMANLCGIAILLSIAKENTLARDCDLATLKII